MKIQLNPKLKKIIHIFGGIVIIIVGILTLASIILGIYLNPSEMMIKLLGNALMFGSMYFMYKYSKTLRDKQRVAWNSHPELRRVFYGLTAATWIFSLFIIIHIIDYGFDLRLLGIPDLDFESIFSAIFSWVTFLAVAYASKYATLITRGFLITQILLNLLVYFFNKGTTDRSELWFLIPGSAIMILVCVKGLIITFGKSWKEQFKTQKSPFIIILIIFLSMSIVFLSNTKIHKKSTSTFPPLEQTK